MRTLLSTVAIALALVVAPPGARAADADPQLAAARVHVQAALAYYDDGRYDDAAHEMEAAWTLKPLPALQYNLAQCYERLGRVDDALTAYRRYLEGLPTADDAEQVRARVANLEKRRAAQAAGQAPPPAPPPTEKVVFKTIVVYREAPPPPGRAARYAAWGVGVLGLGAIAAGVATAVMASDAARTVSKGGNVDNPVAFDGDARDAQSRGQTYQAISIVGFSVGAVMLAGTVGLFLLGRKIDGEAAPPPIALAPILSPTSAGLACAGSF